MNASGKYPLSLYPELISPVSGFTHSVGNTGKPNRYHLFYLTFHFHPASRLKVNVQTLAFYLPILNIYTTKHVKELMVTTPLLIT